MGPSAGARAAAAFGALLALALSGCLAPAGAPSGLATLPAGPALACPAPCWSPVAGGARAWEPHAAAHPGDPAHLVVGNAVWTTDPATGFRNGWLAAHVSRDAGATWEHGLLPGGPAAGPQHPLGTRTSMGDAFVHVLRDGTVLYAGLAFNHAGHGANAAGAFARRGYALFVARSPDGGLGWPEVAVVAEGQGLLVGANAPAAGPLLGLPVLFDAQDKQWIAEGPDGTLLAAWSNLVGVHPREPADYRCDLVWSASRDGGRTWSPPGLVERGGCRIGAAPVLAASGWHVASVDLAAMALHVASSRDGGATWQSRELGPATPMPAMAVQPRPGGGERLLLAASDGSDPAQGDYYWEAKVQPPLLRWSDDGGSTWEGPVALDGPAGPGRTVPQVAVDGEGTAVFTFLRPRDGAAALVARAYRGGLLGEPLVLDPDIAAPAWALGDYMGLAPLPRGAYAAWVRSADGEAFDVAGATIRPG